MSLKEQLKEDLKTAMREKEVVKRDSIRAINTMIKQIEVDERKDLNEEVFRILKKRKKTISVAESCTGGLVSERLTSLAGASKIFKAGVVVYSNESKIKILKVEKKYE